MQRILRLKQKWETHDKGALVPVEQDTYDLLIKAEMAEAVAFDVEHKMLLDMAQAEANADAETAAATGITLDDMKRVLGEILDKRRQGVDPVPDVSGGEGSGSDAEERPTTKKLGWKSTGEWWKAVGRAIQKHQAVIDPRLTDEHIVKTTGYHEVGDDSLGGYLVPEDIRAQLSKEQLEATVVRGNGANVVPTMRDALVTTAIEDYSHSSTVFGNVVFYWINEGATLTASNLKFRQVRVPIHKLAGLCYVTSELLADANVSVEAEVRSNFASGAAWFEDYAFLNGTGAGEPAGILNSGAGISVTRNTASNVKWVDCASMYARQRYPGRAVWVANQATLPQLLQMVGGTEVIWIGLSQGATNAPPGTLLGRPIVFTEKVPTLGTAGDFCFIDMSSYVIGDRENIRIDRSDEVQFTSDQVGFRFILRVGGRVRVDSAFTPRNGSTLSPIVKLN